MCKFVGNRLDGLRYLMSAALHVALAVTAFSQAPETISGTLPDTTVWRVNQPAA